MYTFRLLSVAAGLVLACAAPAQTQSPKSDTARTASNVSLTAELGAAQLADLTGAELGVGGRYAWRNVRFSGIVGGFITANQDDRYRSETFSNGNSVCRDTSNGQFSDDSNCAPDVSAYGKLEASYLFDGGFEIGGGARFSQDNTAPYGTIGYRWSQGYAVYAAGGDDYVSLGLALRY